MMTQGKKYSVSIMQTAHLDMKQPTNLYLHYAEQLEKAKKHNQYLLRHKKPHKHCTFLQIHQLFIPHVATW